MSTRIERYQFTNGWTMEREPQHPYYWVLRNDNERQIDRDQYRHDVFARYKLKVDRYDGPDNAATFVDDLV